MMDNNPKPKKMLKLWVLPAILSAFMVFGILIMHLISPEETDRLAVIISCVALVILGFAVSKGFKYGFYDENEHG